MKALALVVVLGFAACAPSPSPSSPPPPVAKQSPAPASPPPTLAAAIRHAARLGPSDATTTVSLSFALKIRNPERLAALIASGKTVSPEAYAAEFGIDPTQVQGAVAEREMPQPGDLGLQSVGQRCLQSCAIAHRDQDSSSGGFCGGGPLYV